MKWRTTPNNLVPEFFRDYYRSFRTPATLKRKSGTLLPLWVQQELASSFHPSQKGRRRMRRLKVPLLVFWILTLYWIYEGAILLMWISVGVGAAFGTSQLSRWVVGHKLPNSWEAYLTIYILAGGVYLQTSFHLLFWEKVLQNLRKRARLTYLVFQTCFIRALVILSFHGLVDQFRARFWTEKMKVEEENGTTTWFLLAVCFLTYTIGRKCRIDCRLEAEHSGFIYISPGFWKFWVMFMFFYGLEFVLLFLCGLPIFLTGLVFRFLFINEYLVYYALLLVGGVMAYVVAVIERKYKYHGPFSTEPMTKQIYSDARSNLILFTIAPMITRWYFRFQFQLDTFEESRNVNFILFSINVAILEMYCGKQMLYYRWKKLDRLEQLRAATEACGDGDGVGNGTPRGSISTGSFSNRSSSTCSLESVSHAGSKDASGANHAIPSLETNNNNNSSNNNSNRASDNPEDVQPRTTVNLIDLGDRDREPADRDVDYSKLKLASPAFYSARKMAPLSDNVGVIKIDKQWRDQMISQGRKDPNPNPEPQGSSGQNDIESQEDMSATFPALHSTELHPTEFHPNDEDEDPAV